MAKQHIGRLEVPVILYEQGACRDTDTGLFYSGNPVQIDRAIQICSQCAVRETCLEYALDTLEDNGVWGGMSEEERRVIRRHRRAAKKNSVA